MIAIMQEGPFDFFLMATIDDWGLVENSIGDTGIGWRAKFVVNGETYEGKAWATLEDEAGLVRRHRKTEVATKVISLDAGREWIDINQKREKWYYARSVSTTSGYSPL